MNDVLTAANVATAVIVINIIAFAMFGIDKKLAEQRRWRVRESTLLTLALLGGSPGAWAGRSVFRHKTRKQPFNAQLRAITALQIILPAAWVGYNLAA